MTSAKVATRAITRTLPPRALAELVLSDGTRFAGVSIGATGKTVGEVVFNTAMTGYQEILTDPSYCQQIVTLTYPHIGNTGTCPSDCESTQAYAAGLVIRDLPARASNWRNEEALPEWLAKNGVVAIAEIDTRQLTRHLRSHGAMPGAIVTEDESQPAQAPPAKVTDNVSEHSLASSVERDVQAFPGLAGMDLAQRVTCRDAYQWIQGTWSLESNRGAEPAVETLPYHVVAMDFGVKHNILRMLVDRGCRVTVVPASTGSADIMALRPDGVFLSNGPGDPEPCRYAIETIRELLTSQVDGKPLPLFGICLGHQLLALASGASTIKMKFGHHGANHPVLDHASGKVMISSQNHGFAVDPDTLGNHLRVTHTSLFDGTLQGIERVDVPAFGFQGHPEASPGPHDVASLFDRFVELF